MNRSWRSELRRFEQEVKEQEQLLLEHRAQAEGDSPNVCCMTTWLLKGEYERFRQLVRTDAGKQHLEKMAGELFKVFQLQAKPKACPKRIFGVGRLRSHNKPPVEALRFLLGELKLPVNLRSGLLRHTTLLLVAVAELNLEVVEVCLRHGADPNMAAQLSSRADDDEKKMHHVDRSSRTGLELDAALVGCPALHVLLCHQLRYTGDRRPLLYDFWSCSRYRGGGESTPMEVAQLLCDHGADICKENEQGASPVMFLLQCCGQWPLKGKGVCKRCGTPCRCYGAELRYSPVDKCAGELLRFLVQEGAELPGTIPEEISLQRLLMKGFSSVVREMVKLGADVHAEGRLAMLRCAVTYADVTTLECVLDADAGQGNGQEYQCEGEEGPMANEGGRCDSMEGDISSQRGHTTSDVRLQQADCGQSRDHDESRAMDRTEQSECTDGATLPGGSSYTPDVRDDLVCAAMERGEIAILQLLCRRRITPQSRSTLLTAASTLDSDLVQCLVDTGEWPSVDVADALKFQAAILTAIDQFMMITESDELYTFGGYRYYRPAEERISAVYAGDVCSRSLSQLSLARITRLVRAKEDLLLSADELLRKAVQICHASGISSYDAEITIWGQVVREAASLLDLEQLKQVSKTLDLSKGSRQSMSGERHLDGSHFHALLVLQRLAPDSLLYVRYLVSLLTTLLDYDRPKSCHMFTETGRREAESNALSRYGLVLQLISTASLLDKEQLEPMWHIFSELGDCVTRVVDSLHGFYSSELRFNLIPMFEWLGRMVGAAQSDSVKAASLVARLLISLAKMKPAYVLPQLQGILVTINSTGEKDQARRGRFRKDVMLELFRQFFRLRVGWSQHEKIDILRRHNSKQSCANPSQFLALAVEGLFGLGFPLPDLRLPTSFLHEAISSDGHLFRVLVRHSLDVLSYRHEGRPLLAVAVDVGTAETVHCMLDRGAGQHWVDFHAGRLGREEVTLRSQTDVSTDVHPQPVPEGMSDSTSEGLQSDVPRDVVSVSLAIRGSPWQGMRVEENEQGVDKRDLWKIAVQRRRDSDCIAVLKMLTEVNLPMTTAALMQSALNPSLSSDRVHFLLTTFPFTAQERADVLKLHFAHCLWQASLCRGFSTTTLQRWIDFVSLQARTAVSESVDQEATVAGRSLSDTGQLGEEQIRDEQSGIMSLVEKLTQAVQACEGLLAEPALPVLSVAGYEVREAWTWSDFVELTQVSIATEHEQPLNGLLLHSLLVFARVLPEHPTTIQMISAVVVQKGPNLPNRPGTIWSASHAPSFQYLSHLDRYAILVHFVRVWQAWHRSSLKRSLAEQMFVVIQHALTLTKHIFQFGGIVDILPVFTVLCHLLSSSPGSIQESDLGFAVAVDLLLELAHPDYTSPPVVRQLERASFMLAKVSAHGAATRTDENVLHFAVQSIFGVGGRFHMRRMAAGATLFRALLAAPGASRLVNQADSRGTTAAHRLICLGRNQPCGPGQRANNIKSHNELLSTLLELLDEHGQHWDRFYGRQETLLEILKSKASVLPMADALSRRPPSLQCCAATVAAAHHTPETCKLFLPKIVAELEGLHRRPEPSAVEK